jgi:hypothetical protein
MQCKLQAELKHVKHHFETCMLHMLVSCTFALIMLARLVKHVWL